MRGRAMTLARDDAELVLRVLNDDRAAFAELVTRYQGPLYRQGRGMGFDHDVAVDLVQDTFVRAWERLADCRDPAAFRPWLFRVFRNLGLDHLKNLRQHSIPLSELADGVGIVDPRSETDDTLRIAVRSALETVPVLLREAFLLKHDAGYSYEEIAEIVNASPSAVKMRVHRAREHLCTILDGGGSTGPSLLRR